jgi:hypothetical protein
MSAVMFEPNHGHYDPRLIRRQYEGSSLEIGPGLIRWAPPTYPAFHRGGFTVPIGGQPGQAHAVTRIRTAFPSRYSSGLIERYVVSHASGAVLGSFPSGQGISGSMLPEHLAGWYPTPAVQQAVEQAGLVWADRDFIGDVPALDAQFPGVVPHLRRVHRMAWMQSVVFFLCGAAFLGMSRPQLAPLGKNERRAGDEAGQVRPLGGGGAGENVRVLRQQGGRHRGVAGACHVQCCSRSAAGLGEHPSHCKDVGDRGVATREQPAHVDDRGRDSFQRTDRDDTSSGAGRHPCPALGQGRVAG